jgi:hypothetical protein
MGQLSLETWIQLCIWMAVLLGIVILGMVVVQRFRGSAAGKGATPGELLTNFQEMRERGDISDADYRRIKSVLGDKIQGDSKGGRNKL